MPELPEVETVRLALAPVLAGRRLVRVRIHDARLVAPLDPRMVAGELEGERVARVDRRGKYLIVRFESGRSLLIHLRMTGSLRHSRNGSSGAEHDAYARAVISLDNGSDVVYRDIRRFGTWRLLERSEEKPYLAKRLGAEPLSAAFTARVLRERLRGRRIAVKGALLDQRVVAGLGNIYADEALWRARIHPLRRAGEVAPGDVTRLHRALRDALRLGVARQGATLRNYERPGGETGAMQEEFRVYGRAGEPCDRCGRPIEKTRVAGRGTSYCPGCQA